MLSASRNVAATNPRVVAVSTFLSLWLGGCFVLAARDCCFGGFEAGSRGGPVAEWLGGGAAAAAQSKRTLGNCVSGAVPIDRRHIVALDQIGTVLKHFDRCHLDVLP